MAARKGSKPHNLHEPTPETRAKVSALISFGVTHEDIATYIGIKHDTLTRKYRHELDTGSTHANSKVAARLFRKAVVEGDTAAMVFWLKTRARWREKDPENTTDANSIIEKLIDKIQ